MKYTDPELKSEWNDEIERRLNEIESGVEKGIPAAAVMETARRALSEAQPIAQLSRVHAVEVFVEPEEE